MAMVREATATGKRSSRHIAPGAGSYRSLCTRQEKSERVLFKEEGIGEEKKTANEATAA